MKHVPEWFPGTGFKQFAKVDRRLFDVAVDGPLDYVKETLKVRLSMLRTSTSILWTEQSCNFERVEIDIDSLCGWIHAALQHYCRRANI